MDFSAEPELELLAFVSADFAFEEEFDADFLLPLKKSLEPGM